MSSFTQFLEIREIFGDFLWKNMFIFCVFFSEKVGAVEKMCKNLWVRLWGNCVKNCEKVEENKKLVSLPHKMMDCGKVLPSVLNGICTWKRGEFPLKMTRFTHFHIAYYYHY